MQTGQVHKKKILRTILKLRSLEKYLWRKYMETWTHLMHFKWEVTWTHGTQPNTFYMGLVGK